MKKLLTILGAVMMTAASLKAQFSFSSENATTMVQFIPCGAPDTLQINITAAGAQTSAQVGVKLPSNGVFSSLVSGGTLLSSSTDSFTVALGNMTSGQTITLRYRVRMNCIGASSPAFNASYLATSTTHSSSFTGQSYASSVYAPVLQFLAVDIDTSGLQEGGIHTRKYTIANSSASAISYFDTIYFRGKYKAGETFVNLKIGSTTVTPTQSGDSLLYAIAGTLLDADGRLNGGQSISVEERVQITNQCVLNNATTDAVQAYYGCYATRGCTAPVQLNAATQVASTLNQLMQAFTRTKLSACRGAAPDTLFFTVYNPPSAGKARDVTFNIQSNFTVYNYDSRMTGSFMLANTLSATKNGVAYNLMKDTTLVKQKHEELHAGLIQGAPIWYANVPADAMYDIQFRLDSMNPGDTIRGSVLYSMLCDDASLVDYTNYYWRISSPGFGPQTEPGFKNLRSKNNCGGNWVYSYPGSNANVAPSISISYFPSGIIGSIIGDENYYPADTGSVRLLMTNQNVGSSSITSRAKYQLRVVLPVGLKPSTLSPSAYPIKNQSNESIYVNAYAVNVVGNELRIDYRNAGSINLDARYVDIPLYLDCSLLSGPKLDSIRSKWYINMDTTCASGCGFMNFSRTSNLNVSLHCPGTLPDGGFEQSQYEHRRWNIGLADYNNDGLADGTGRANPDSVNTYTYIFGDTMYTKQQGRVITTGTTPAGGFTHGYAVHKMVLRAVFRVPETMFNQVFSKLKVYDASASTSYVYDNIPATRVSFGDTVYYIYALGKDSIAGKGSIPAGFTFANGDSISLETYRRFRLNETNENVYNLSQDYEIYLTTSTISTSSTSSIENHTTKYTNEIKSSETDIFRNMILGTLTGSTGFSVINTCVASANYDQNAYGGVTQRIYSNLVFYKEFRPFTKLTNIQTTIPRKGIKIDSIQCIYTNSGILSRTVTIPASMYTLKYDSGYAKINIQQVLPLLSLGTLIDEGFQLTFRHFFKRNGAVQDYDPNSFPAFSPNFFIGVDHDFSETHFADLPAPINPHAFSTKAGANVTRFLNPIFSGSALGAVTKTISGKSTTFDIQLDNATGAQQMDVDSAWVYFYSPSGAIKLVGASDIISNTALPVANGKLVRLGTMNAGSSRSVRLNVDFAAGCGTDSFRVFYSWNCPSIVSPSADSQLTNYFVQDTTTHTITKFDPILENSTSVSRTSNIALCDTILVSTVMNNAGGGIGYDIDFSFTTPNFGAGVELVPGSFRLQYPALGGPIVTIPSPTAIGGGQYSWTDITQYISALDTQGLASFSDPVNNKMRITFQTRFTCGFNSGLTLNTFSQASCGTVGTAAFTTPIRLKAENKAGNQFYTCNTDADTINTCGLASANTLRTVFTNLAASVNPSGTNDSIFVYLPAGVTYNSGVSASPRGPDKAVVQPDGRQRLSWRVNGIASGASQTFTYGVTGNDTLSCNVIQIQNQSGAFVQDTCILDGSLCLTGVIKSDVNSNLTIQKPAVNFTAATATSVYNATTPVNEIVTINYTVVNTGTTSSAHQIRTYHDADASGTFTPGDVLVNTRTINTSIANGGTYSGTFNLDLLSSQTCPLVLVIEQAACQCVRSQRAINSIKLNNAGLDTGLCHGTSIVLGTGTGPSAYTYAWTPATGLSSTSSSSPTLSGTNVTGANIVTNYILSTTRNSVASCTNMDTVVVTVRPLPTIAVLRDTSICLGQSVTYTQIGGGIYSWNTLPVQTTAAITVSPTTNTEYRVTVTSANGCQRSDTAVVSLRSTPVANAGGAKSRVNCAGDSVQVGSAAIASHTYAWSPATGLSATNVAMPWAKPAVTTSYKMTITNSVTGCTSVDSAVVTVNASSLAANAGNDATVCQGTPTITVGSSPTASGGTAPYTYAWSPATGLSSTSIANPTAATTTAAVTNYALMLTDGKGCIARDTVRVMINAKPSVAPTAAPATVCNGSASTIAANATGGTTPYTYTWTPAGSGASHSQSPVSTTNYGVTVTDANTCTASGTVTLNVTGTSPLTANAGNARTICSGASTNLGGSPTAGGGSGGFTYAWTSSPAGFISTSANPTVSPTVSTTYTLTVTSSGCTATNTVVVTVNPTPTIAPSASATTICNGQSVTISANAAGGTAPLGYTWNIGSGASHSHSPTTNTTYQVTTTDANGCSANGSVTINVIGSTPLAADAGTARAICNGASTSLGGVPTATGGAGGYTYAWSNSAGTTANPTVSPTATTTYTVTVTSSGCTATASVVVTVNPKPSVAPSATPSTICNGQSTTVAANATGGTAPLTYAWSGGGSGASFSATPSSTTSYSVTVSDANTCTAIGSVTVNVTGISPLVANAGTARTICSGVSTSLGAVPTATGGSGGYTYAWSGGASAVANPTVSPTTTTTYTLTVTSSGCTATSSVVVTVNPSPTTAPSVSATTICNGESVTINANAAGGTAPLSYTWNNGAGASHVKSPTANTTYLVTVTDANSCTATGSVSVTVTGSTPLASNAGAARAICNGASTNLGGTPTATGGAGGYTYAWSGGAGAVANPTVSPSTTTTYTVTVTSSGCTVSSSVVVTVNPKPSAAPTATPAALCNGESTTIAANATGGTAPLTYSWGSGSTASSFTATPSTTTAYALTVTDANGCTASGSVTVNVTGTSPLVAVAGSARAICNGGSTTLGGSPTASGGAGGYTYSWSGGAGSAANPVVSPTTTTTYTLTVTSSGCTATSSVVVTVNPKPNVAPSASLTNVCFGSSSTVSANASGGTAPLTYNWSPSGSGASFVATPNATTIFNVTVTDANGCTASGNVSVNVTGSSPLTVNAGTNRTICNGSSTNLGAAPTGNGGNTSGTYTYSWSSNPAGFTSTAANPTVSPTATTTYTVTVTNTGCTATNTVVVSVNPRPAAAPNASVNPVCSGSNTTITANASGGTSPYTYQWNTSQTSASFVASPTTTTPIVNAYTVTVTDVNSCSISATVNVNVTPLPLVATIGNQSICIPATGGSVALNAAALTGGQTGAWTTVTSPSGTVSFSTPTAANTNVSTLSPTNTYTFRWTLTENGCSNSTTTNVTVNESPVIEAGVNDTICLNTIKTLSASLTSVSPASINWKVNTISATPFAFTTSTNVSPTVTTRYIFTAAISPCIVSDSVVVAVIGVPNLVDDLATCLSATEDVSTTFNIPTTIGSNDALGLVLRGGVTYKVLSSKNSTATVSGTTLNYASNLNFYGKDTVIIEAYSNECTPLRDTAMFCVDVAGVNDKPVLTSDTVKTVGTNPKSFNPLANDSDIETTLKGGNVTVLSGPNSGTLTGPATDGTFTYTGNSNNLATLDTIVIQVCDSGLPMPAQCDISRIIVQLVPEIKDSTVMSRPGNPITSGPLVTKGPGVSMTPKLIGTNGTNGTIITTTSGTATIDPVTGVMIFTPNDTPFIGKDTIRKVFCFTYPDGSEACDTSLFIVSNPSVTNTSSDSTPMNTPKVVGSLKPYKFEGGISMATTMNATVDSITGAVTYTPRSGFVGVDTAKVTRCDSKGNCVTDVMVVKVTPNLPDTNVTASGSKPLILGPAILGGNGATVETTLVGPTHGTATKNADGTVTYTPSGSYVGRDTITRIVKVTYPDGSVKYDTQMIIVKNTIPDDINNVTVKQDEKKDIGTLPRITFEGTPTTPVITSSAGGTTEIGADGIVTYTPKPDFFGTDTIKIVRCDNLGNCVTSIYIVKVEKVVSEIPNYISPNGDGINDVWNIDGLLNRYPNAKVIIYNRWGNVVWRSTGAYGKSTSGTNVWYGQLEGSSENVPDGVYYYLLELEDEFKTTKTGFIEIMRQ